MANLAASASLMIAVALPWSDMLVRMLFGLLLNLFVYLTNDAYDIEADLASPRKDHDKARFLDAHRRAVRLAQAGLLAALGAVAAWSAGLMITYLVAVPLCWLYCARLKRAAGFDLVTIVACTVSGTMLAFPLDSALGWVLAVQLGLFSASFQTIQMIRDHDDDRAFGTRTTAVALGVPRTAALERVVVVVSAAYAIVLVHRWLGLLILLAAVLPFDAAQAARQWNRVRAIFGVAWLGIVAWVVWRGATYGLLSTVSREHVLEVLTALR